MSADRIGVMIQRRRDFHRYPESGWAEFRTTAKIAEVMNGLGFVVRMGGDFFHPESVMGRTVDTEREMERAVCQGADAEWVKRTGGFTGLSAELNTGRKGPVVAIRVGIDCVDVDESTDAAHVPAREGFTSVNPGWMHASGNDGHIALALAVAEYVSANPDCLDGVIRFLFQPAEEGVRGAYAMTQAGLLDDVDYLIALHLGFGVPTGVVYGGTRGFLCTTKIDANFYGKAAHAGAEPNEGKNALLAAASAALNLYAIAPHKEGTSRVNVGVLNAGEGRNVVPPRAVMKLETRGANDKVLGYVYDRAVQIIEGAAAMYDCKVEIEKCGEANTASSDAGLVHIICDAARNVPGVFQVYEDHEVSVSDDACWMMRRVQEHGGKAAYIGLGSDTAGGHHSDRFDFDEASMPIGYVLLCSVLERLIGH